AFTMAFWRDTVVDGSVLAKWNSALGRRSAKARLAHLLCEMGIRFETVGLGKGDEFDFPITQSQLADVLGVTAVHLNRTIQALRMDGLLVTRGSLYHLPDPGRLRRLAQFDPSYLLLGRDGAPD
ncbi:MAG TPA: helix-turn-helix domain-containing protein, partial [Sphingomicrobium sp.]|nr:helix-turn-helix domain-containing protein [Sphingomicrobium sp.]